MLTFSIFACGVLAALCIHVMLVNISSFAVLETKIL